MNARSFFSTALVVAILSLPLWLHLYRINGFSMVPTLFAGDIIVVDAISLHFMRPTRGELIVVRNPHKKNVGEVDLKRVIGLPGETIHVRGDRVVINVACDESDQLTAPQFTPMRDGDGPCQHSYLTGTLIGGLNSNGNFDFDMFLGPLDYFVLGDNRPDSADSRSFGAVQPEDFVGRALVRLLPRPDVLLR